MSIRDQLAVLLAEIVGEDICGPMADRHIMKFLMEKNKKELTDEDIKNYEFANWLNNRLKHLSMIKPEAIDTLISKIKSL